MIDASLNEVESVAAKAARGAGLSWGLAEDTGKAARWLATHGLPWAASLIQQLGEQDGFARPVATSGTLAPADSSRELSPLIAGAYISDAGMADSELRLEPVTSPMWLLPFVARLSTSSGRMIRVEWDAASVILSFGQCFARPTEELIARRTDRVTVSLVPAGLELPTPLAVLSRSRIAVAHWRELDEIGARTYVASSVQSRAKGAGAGLVDND